MYVIQNGTRTYPADRCDWIDSEITGTDGVNVKTRIKTVRFYPGNAAAQSLSDPSTLGYLGKYGRFIPITD